MAKLERKIEIIKAARHLFDSKGYENMTMQKIMKELDIAKGTIYHYFESKEALFEAVIEEIVGENVTHMRSLIEGSQKNALQKLQLLVSTGNISEENRAVLDGLHKPANSAMHSRLLAHALIKQAPLYAEIIQQGCDEGVFKTETPLECAEFILSAVQFLTDKGIYSWTEKDLNRRMHAFPKLLEQQLQAPSGSFQFLFKKHRTSQT
ncbi:MAG: TetR/AcrR family transcriptional regulator [Candidatus Algichlamydia australiensis]|nr:TetR/AcrR family transcriptional regulator [Chlamydiales bacterium]